MRFQRDAQAFFAFTTVSNFLDRLVQNKVSRKWQPDGVVELRHRVGELQFGCQ